VNQIDHQSVNETDAVGNQKVILQTWLDGSAQNQITID